MSVDRVVIFITVERVLTCMSVERVFTFIMVDRVLPFMSGESVFVCFVFITLERSVHVMTVRRTICYSCDSEWTNLLFFYISGMSCYFYYS